MNEEKKGTTRLGLSVGIICALTLAAIAVAIVVMSYVRPGSTDQTMSNLVVLIVAAIVSNLDRILVVFFPKAGVN